MTTSFLKKLPREFYDRDTVTVARDLLGKYLVHVSHGKKLIGKIVEVEAYLGQHDLAAHSSKGMTPRNKIMFGPPGFAYVYLVYGMHYCLNVVTEHEGSAAAILFRAIEPIENIKGRTQGPGLLCKALQIDKRMNGHDFVSDELYIASSAEHEKFVIVKKSRIGVAYAKHWAKRLLRFYIKGNVYVSKI